MLCVGHALVDLNRERVQICIMFCEPCSCQFKWRDGSNLFISFCVGHALVDFNGERVQIFVTFYVIHALVDLSGEWRVIVWTMLL